MEKTTQCLTPSTQHLILASASPARLELLKSIGLTPDKVAPSDVDETPLHAEKPEDYVLRVACAKARAVAALHPGAFILAADTAASIGRSIIGKAEDAAHARKIIGRFSGRRHRVHTGVCAIAPNGTERVRRVTTVVKFACISKEELEAYIASDEWRGKAGAFGIQGSGGGFIEWVNGSVSSVIGLPLSETKKLLKGMGYHAPQR